MTKVHVVNIKVVFTSCCAGVRGWRRPASCLLLSLQFSFLSVGEERSVLVNEDLPEQALDVVVRPATDEGDFPFSLKNKYQLLKKQEDIRSNLDLPQDEF